MSNHYDELLTLLSDTLNKITSPAAWQEFLRTAAYNYKMEFHEQVLLYAQKPTATAVMSEVDWKGKYNRVIQTDTPIELLSISEEISKNYYDISDTHSAEEPEQNVPIFRFGDTPEHQAETISALNKVYGLNENRLETAVFSAADSVAAYHLDNIYAELESVIQIEHPNYSNPSVLRQRLSRLIANSAAYMCLTRCNYPLADFFSNADFRDAEMFGTQALISVGTVMSSVSYNIMQTIIRANMRVDKKMYENQNRTFANSNAESYNIDNNQPTNDERQVENHVSESELLWSGETRLPQRAQADSLYGDGNEKRVKKPSSDHTGGSLRNVGTADQTESSRMGAVRTAQDGRSDEVDRTNDQPARNHEDAGAREANLQLKTNKAKKAVELNNTLPLFLSQEQVDEIIQHGSHSLDGKYRIYEQFQKKETLAKNVEFLKNEYGIGGYSASNDFFVTHNNKGIEIVDYDRKEKYKMPWKAVAKRISQLMEVGRYLSPAETENYPAYRIKQEERAKRTSLSNEFSTLVREYNAAATEPLNSYILLLGCANEFVAGKSVTYTGTATGENIYNLIFNSLGTIEKKPEFSTRAAEMKKAFLPYRDADKSSQPDVQYEIKYVYQPGDQVYIGTKKYEILAADDKVILSDVMFPLFQETYEKAEFENLLKENPMNGHLKVKGLTSEEKAENFLLAEQTVSVIKAENPDAILFYQVGDFFELYGNDAAYMSDTFSLHLTNKTVDGERVMMCGVPAHQLEVYLNLLTDRGLDVAISTFENNERVTRLIVSQEKLEPVESRPVGKIEYLHTDGSVRESIEYTSEYQFVKDIQEENRYGVPMSIVLYRDKNGQTISQDFASNFDPIPQGFRVEDFPVSENPLIEEAKKLIDDFCRREYDLEEGADYSDLSRVEIAYTTTEDEKHGIQVAVDLVNPAINTYIDDTLVESGKYKDMEELVKYGLFDLDYGALIYVSEEQLAPFYRIDENTVPAEQQMTESQKDGVTLPATPQPKQKLQKRTQPHLNFRALERIAPQIITGEYQYIKLEAGDGFMPLTMEQIGKNRIAIAHYYVQNGDMMADPDMEFIVDSDAGTLEASAYQQDNMEIYQNVYPEDGKYFPKLQKELNSFANQWFKNIQSQGYAPVKAITRDDKTLYFGENQKPYLLGYGYLGSGLTVWNAMEEKNHDYVILAHISPEREISYSEKNLPKMVKDEIECQARTAELTVSATQVTPVFSVPPKPEDIPVNEEKTSLPAESNSVTVSFNEGELTPIVSEGNTLFQPTVAADEAQPSTINYRITDNDLGVAGPKERFRNNIEAINTLHNLEFENRSATPEEQEILSRYVGWGGLSDAFDESKSDWANEFTKLYTVLSPEEYKDARASVLTAFYTPPVIIKAMYDAIEKMGFHKGNICDPACGIGHFIGMLPDSLQKSKFYGVEIDSVSGRIAQQLYPQASIAVQGFENTTIPDSFLDVMIGNVPFGAIRVYDKRYDKNKFLIHDYFFAKALDKVRPGGVIAFITSKGTMDKPNPSVRKYIAERAELIGAIRLPDNVFIRAAGTEVTSDIIFLQKRDRAIAVESDWVYLDTDENGITMNRYFVEHPEMILGSMVMESSRFGTDSTCKADESISLEAQLQSAIGNLYAKIEVLETLEPTMENAGVLPADPNVRSFSYTLVDGEIYYRENSRMVLCDAPAKTKERIRGMIAIRDCLRQLMEYQVNDAYEQEICEKQSELNQLYDNFVKDFGRLTSRINQSAFHEDSSSSLIYALEIIDENGNFLKKADVFTKRTIKAHKEVTHADTVTDALAISIAERAKVDMDFMQKLTGMDEQEIVVNLRGIIFLNPDYTGEECGKEKYLNADEYLSGNVRAKLAAAEQAAQKDSETFSAHVEALRQVQPKDLTAAEISVKLGSKWVPEEVYNQFIYELLNTPAYAQDRIAASYNPLVDEWKISNRSFDNSNIKAYSTYGTRRASAYRLIEDALNQRDTRIYDTVQDDEGKEKSVLNGQETAIAQGKQETIRQAFVTWLWKEPERRHRLCKLYNETFNSIRPREYNGQHIAYHGMNPQVTMRPHQNDAVAHILYGNNVLLAHTVGAGKTFEMAAAAMESKALGLCQKSIFVVPNHIIGQWASEFLLLYPNANLLIARKEDFQRENRRRFFSKIATGDFDAIIIGQSQFEKIPMSIQRREEMIYRQITELERGIKNAERQGGEHYSVKSMERAKRKLEGRLKRLTEQSRKDHVLTFEELGVDKMFVDEAHYYKNLFFATKMRDVAGISQSEVNKTADLFMKCQYLDEITGEKGIVFATGTPISNSMVEMYTMQRYLQYSKLKELGLEYFDSWASNFGETVTAMELAPDGSGYRFKTRFAKFNNLPELMSMFKEVADIRTADMLDLDVPKANYHNIVIQPSDFQKEYIESLAQRSEAVHLRKVSPYEDNMLKITNDGRKLALDERLIDPTIIPAAETKASICAENVFRIWQETAAGKSAQLVFCDLSTPKGSGEFNVYDKLKQILSAKGIPETEIAFIHDAKTDTQKKTLFAKVRNGSVRVLIGSTQKMGAGTNVQDRLIALHHLDCPWRPSDLEQREGRIIRQGNKNSEVEIYRYVTEATFDAYMWQLVESKQKFIAQIMTSKAPVRSAEDVDETSLSYSEVKALASGNPMIMEKCQLDAEIGRLNLQKANFLTQKYELEDKITQYYPQEIQSLKDQIKGLSLDIQCAAKHPVPDEGLSPMNLGDTVFTDRATAGKQLLSLCDTLKSGETLDVGTYRGFKLSLTYTAGHFYLDLKNRATHTVTLGADELGNIQRIENAIGRLEDNLKDASNELAELQHQFQTAKVEVKNEFPHEAELSQKQERLAKVNALLASSSKNKEKAQQTPAR